MTNRMVPIEKPCQFGIQCGKPLQQIADSILAAIRIEPLEDTRVWRAIHDDEATAQSHIDAADAAIRRPTEKRMIRKRDLQAAVTRRRAEGSHVHFKPDRQLSKGKKLVLRIREQAFRTRNDGV